MKRIMAAIAATIVLFTMAACSDANKPAETSQTPQEKSEPLVPPEDVNTDAEELAEILDEEGLMPGVTADYLVESGMEDAAESMCREMHKAKYDPILLDAVINGWAEGYGDREESFEVLGAIIVAYCPEIREVVNTYAGQVNS